MMKSEHPSFGGTFLGFVLGLLIGLLVALGVAIYVSKVPIPFLNKAAGRPADSTTTNPEKLKDWDPNAPLSGKKPVKPDEAPATSNSDKPAAETPPVAPTAPTPPAASTSEDPLGDLARERANAPDPYVYHVQVGSFKSAEEAEALRAKLSLNGYDPKIVVRDVSGQMVHRVRVGPFETKAEAEQVQQKLISAKFSTTLVRIQR